MLFKLGVVVVMVAACSKPADKSNAAPSTTEKPAASHGAGGCDKIPLADFQALITDKITSVTGAPVGACNAYVGKELGLAVVIDPGRDFEPGGPGVHPLTGIGDQAYWHAGDAGITGPHLLALKGKTICEIDTPAPPHTTLKSDADSEAYMKLAGTLCNDMFAAQ
jgi:hypothetical protein